MPRLGWRAPGEVRDAVLRVLADGVPRTSRQLADLIGGTRHNMKQTLQRMARAGMVTRDARLLCLRSEPRERLYALPEFDDRLPADDVSWFDPVQPPPIRKRRPPGQLTRRPRGAIRSAVIALLADNRPRGASQVATALGITKTHARTALRRAAEAGVIARDRRERRMGREERLFAALEVEDSLPESDRPWFEDFSQPTPAVRGDTCRP